MLIPFKLQDKFKILGKVREAEATVVDINIIVCHKNRGKARRKNPKWFQCYVVHIFHICCGIHKLFLTFEE
jgi:hypothetical protein